MELLRETIRRVILEDSEWFKTAERIIRDYQPKNDPIKKWMEENFDVYNADLHIIVNGIDIKTLSAWNESSITQWLYLQWWLKPDWRTYEKTGREELVFSDELQPTQLGPNTFQLKPKDNKIKEWGLPLDADGKYTVELASISKDAVQHKADMIFQAIDDLSDGRYMTPEKLVDILLSSKKYGRMKGTPAMKLAVKQWNKKNPGFLIEV